MSGHKVTGKLTRKFTKFVFQYYTRHYGYSKTKLSEKPIPWMLTESHKLPEEFINKTSKPFSYTTQTYLDELKGLKYLTRDNNTSLYYLTPKGFKVGYKLTHPIKYLFSEHWKILLPVFVAFCLVIIGMLNYLKTQ